MKEGEKVEAEVGPKKLPLVRLVTTKSNFRRKEGTYLVTDHNVTPYGREEAGEIHKS